MATTTLYAWAHPLSAWKGADHTWVTTFPAPAPCPPPKDYWYCWGICHATGPGTNARLLTSGPGDLRIASCICTPNDPKAYGGINLYGIEGVCHQVANRVLYASQPLQTVQGSHLYWLSHLLFGAYGTTHADWAQRRKRCGAGAQLPAGGSGGGTIAGMDDEELDRQALQEVLRQKMGTAFREDALGRFEAVRAGLLADKARLDRAVQAQELSGEEFARQVNELLTSYLPRFAAVIGVDATREVFGVGPGETVELLDPAMAATSDYRSGGAPGGLTGGASSQGARGRR